MDIFRFINSRDIREHLKKTGYQFNTLETAWLVNQSRTATMQERFHAWEEIIATMPDCAPQRPQKTTPNSSFHALLREYIDLQKKKLALFYDGEGAVYQYALAEAPARPSLHAEWIDRIDIFPDVENCIRECVEEWKTAEEDGCATYLNAKITKRWLRRPDDGGDDQHMEAIINKSGALLSLYYDFCTMFDEHQAEIDYLLEDMWFDFPTPFERGDILIEAGKPWNPFVLDDMFSWDSQRLRENGFSAAVAEGGDVLRERLKKGGVSWDMEYHAWYYGIYTDGLFSESGCNYMDLERYRGPLKDGYRCLKAVSSFLKEWVREGCMDIGLLCNACGLIWQEERSRNFQDSLDRYINTALRDYGIPKRKSKR